MSSTLNKHKNLNVRVTQEFWDAFSEMAKINEEVPSKLIRSWIMNYLENSCLDENYLDYLRITNGYDIQIPKRKIKND